MGQLGRWELLGAPWVRALNMGMLKMAYVKVGRGCVAMDLFLEVCARGKEGVCFVAECWVARTGSGTKLHPDYVMLGSTTKCSKVVVFVRRDLVDGVELAVATAHVVIVKVGGCNVGGIYGKCGIGVHDMKDWLGSMTGWVGRGDWVLLGDWNAHHHTWSLDGRSGLGGRVLLEWVQEHGAEVHFGGGGTVERRRGGDMVQSQIDCVVLSPDCSWKGEDDDWLQSDHACIERSLLVGELERVDERQVVDWDRLTITLADEDQGWYVGLAIDMAYDKLLDLRRKHVKSLRVCGHSKRWWNWKIAAQLAVVRDHRWRLGRNRDWIR